MASTSCPVTATCQNHLWNPAQPIRFAPPTLQDISDKRWQPGMPITFANPPTSSKSNTRTFSTTMSRHAPGDRSDRPSLRSGASSAQASIGEDAAQAVMAAAIIKKRAADITKRKKGALLAEARRKEEEAREAHRIQEEAIAMERKRQADIQGRARILAALQDIEAQLAELGDCGPLFRLLSESVVDFKAQVKLQNIENFVAELEHQAQGLEQDFRLLEGRISARVQKEFAQLQLLRHKLRQAEAEADQFGILPLELKILQRSVPEFKTYIRTKNLDNLVDDVTVREIDAIHRDVHVLAAAIVKQWQLRIQKLRKPRHLLRKPTKGERVPIFLQSDEILLHLDQVILQLEKKEFTAHPWWLICYVVDSQRVEQAVQKKLLREKAMKIKEDQKWRKLNQRRALMRAQDEERYWALDRAEGTLGYGDFRKPFKRAADALFEARGALRSVYQDQVKHLRSQEKQWCCESSTLRCVQRILSKATDNVASSAGVLELMHSIDTTLGSIDNDLTLFAAAFRYESLKLTWHYNKFFSAVREVGTLGHRARQEARIRIGRESSEPCLTLMARMRHSHLLLSPLRWPMDDWKGLETMLRLECQWFPPNTYAQLVDVRKYENLDDFLEAEAQHTRTKFGPLVKEMLELSRYANATARDCYHETFEQNTSQRLVISQFSCEPLAQQVFYRRTRPLIQIHQRVFIALNEYFAEVLALYDSVASAVRVLKTSEQFHGLARRQTLRRQASYKSFSEKGNLIMEIWATDVNAAVNEVGLATYDYLRKPEYAEYLTKAAPSLQSWFAEELTKERAKAGRMSEFQQVGPRSGAPTWLLAKENPKMMAELRAIDTHSGDQTAQSEDSKPQRTERKAGLSIATQLFRSEQLKQLGEKGETILTSWEVQWGEKTPKIDPRKVSETDAVSGSDLKNVAGSRLNPRRRRLARCAANKTASEPQSRDEEQASQSAVISQAGQQSEATKDEQQSHEPLICDGSMSCEKKLREFGGQQLRMDMSHRSPEASPVSRQFKMSRSSLKLKPHDSLRLRRVADSRHRIAPPAGSLVDFGSLMSSTDPLSLSEESQSAFAIQYHSSDNSNFDGPSGQEQRLAWNKPEKRVGKEMEENSREGDTQEPRSGQSKKQGNWNDETEYHSLTPIFTAEDRGKVKNNRQQDDKQDICFYFGPTLDGRPGKMREENDKRGKQRMSHRSSELAVDLKDIKKPQKGSLQEKEHIDSRSYKPTTAAVDDENSMKEDTQKERRESPPYRSFKPSEPKQAPHPSLLTTSPQTSDSFDHQFGSTSDNASDGVGDMDSSPESTSEQDSSEPETTSDVESGSDPESGSDNDSISSSEIDSDAASEEESYTPLGYQIPVDQIKAAMLASPGTPASFWSHKLYRGPSDEKVTVHYCRSKETGETVAKLFLGKPVLGFDIEWKPQAKATSGLKSNISLIQLACEDRVGLFHIALHKGETPDDILPPTLRAIIASPNVLKAGVAIMADFSRVTKFLDIPATGLIELSHWHRLVTYSKLNPELVNKKLVGLAAQVHIHLQLPLFKGDVRTSDWSKQLNHDQCTYAAADAYASYRVYEALEEKRIAMRPRPPRPEFAELKLPIKLADQVVVPESSSNEESVQAIDEVESLCEKLEKLSIGLGDSPVADETLTDEELLTIEAVAHDVEVEDLTKETTFVEPKFEESISNVRYPVLPPFEDLSESPPAVFGEQVHLPNITTTTSTKSSPSKQPTPVSSLSSEERQSHLAAATAWAETQALPASSHSRRGSRSYPGMRCYYLWHHARLDLDEIASIVRDPPLKKGTVACYVAEAVGYEGFEVRDVERMEVVLDSVPMAAWGRFRNLRREILERVPGKAKANGKGEDENDEWVV